MNIVNLRETGLTQPLYLHHVHLSHTCRLHVWDRACFPQTICKTHASKDMGFVQPLNEKFTQMSVLYHTKRPPEAWIPFDFAHPGSSPTRSWRSTGARGRKCSRSRWSRPRRSDSGLTSSASTASCSAHARTSNPMPNQIWEEGFWTTPSVRGTSGSVSSRSYFGLEKGYKIAVCQCLCRFTYQ